MCNINYPQEVRFEECPACGEETSPFSNVFVHDDWLDRAVDAVHSMDGEIPDVP